MLARRLVGMELHGLGHQLSSTRIRRSVRLVLIGIMLACLLMAVAIPQAFGDRALLFAGSYVAIQVGRHAFLTFGSAERGTIERERAGRILIWFVASGALWIAGGIEGGAWRSPLWLVALILDYIAPLVHVLGSWSGLDSHRPTGRSRRHISRSASSSSSSSRSVSRS